MEGVMEIIHDSKAGVISIEQDGRVSRLVYRRTDDVLDIVSTVVHPEDRGKGIAAKLVAAALEYVDEHSLRVIPSCSYVATYMQRHKREDLLA